MFDLHLSRKFRSSDARERITFPVDDLGDSLRFVFVSWFEMKY